MIWGEVPRGTATPIIKISPVARRVTCGHLRNVCVMCVTTLSIYSIDKKPHKQCGRWPPWKFENVRKQTEGCDDSETQGSQRVIQHPLRQLQARNTWCSMAALPQKVEFALGSDMNEAIVVCAINIRMPKQCACGAAIHAKAIVNYG
jgi:hypothetical protein